jgi:hypothetical protein
MKISKLYIYIATSWKVAGSIPDEVTQPLTEMSTRNLPGGKGRPAHGADNFTADYLENMGASTSHNRMGLHGLLQG